MRRGTDDDLDEILEACEANEIHSNRSNERVNLDAVDLGFVRRAILVCVLSVNLLQDTSE